MNRTEIDESGRIKQTVSKGRKSKISKDQENELKEFIEEQAVELN